MTRFLRALLLPAMLAGAFLSPPAQAQMSESELVTRTSADRKSTRLNSSHLGISYAVFCLKKKIELISRFNRNEASPIRMVVLARIRFLLRGQRSVELVAVPSEVRTRGDVSVPDARHQISP